MCSDTWPGAPQEPVVSVVLAYQSYFWGCAITARGALVCWGNNESGQLGLGFKSEKAAATPLEIPGRVVDVAIESSSGCAVTEDGGLFCWSDDRVPKPSAIQLPSPAHSIVEFRERIIVTLADRQVAIVDFVPVAEFKRELRASLVPASRGVDPYAASTWPALVLCGLRRSRLDCIGDPKEVDAWVSQLSAETRAREMRALSWSHYNRCGIDGSGGVVCVERGEYFPISGVSDVSELVVSQISDRGCVRLRTGEARCFDLKPGPQSLHDPVAAGAAAPR